MFVGHAVRCARQYCETAVRRPEAQVTQPIQSTMQWRPPISTFQSRRSCCGPASCGKAEHAPQAWGPSCSWHEWQPNPAQAPSGRTDLMGQHCLPSNHGLGTGCSQKHGTNPTPHTLPWPKSRHSGYITTASDFPRPFASNRGSGAWYLIH